MNYKTFRLFISSTFTDFSEERRIINTRITKYMQKLCEDNGFHFEVVDLRWGIRAEASLSQKTMQICLDEIQRCGRGPKPSFLIMLGERYGWIPLPQSIEKHDYEKLNAILSSDDRRLCAEWYILDENLLVPQYILQPRKGAYIDEDEWGKTEGQLRKVLQTASLSALAPEKARELFFTSATEKEIEYGLLSDKALATNTLVYLRDSQGLPKSKAAEQCKQKVVHFMDDAGCADRVFCLDQSAIAYINLFEAALKEKLELYVKEEMQRLSNLAARETNKTAAIRIATQLTQEFYGRNNELRALSEFVLGSRSNICVVRGASGCGKSSLLAKFCLECSLENKIAFFCGIDPEKRSLLKILQEILDDLANFVWT